MDQNSIKAPEDFALDFTPEVLATLPPDDGAPYTRIAVGDYKFRVADVATKPNKKQTFTMLDVSVVVVGAYAAANNDCVGMTTSNLYAGDRGAPKKMQRRLSAFLSALNLGLKPGERVKRSHMVGREFDATIVWELSDPVLNAESGLSKQYVNDRLRYERGVGAQRPSTANPEAESRRAASYLAASGDGEANDGVEIDGAPSPPPAWATQAAPPPIAAQPIAPPPVAHVEPVAHVAPAAAGPASQAAPVVASGFMDEAKVPASAHTYRAHIALGTPSAAQARAALVGHKIDPDGPVVAENIGDDKLKAEFLAKFPPAGAGDGLPELPALGGGRKKKDKAATPQA